MRTRFRLLLALITTTTACLPRGNPPAGRQLIADRSAALAALAPSNGDGMLRVLFMRPNAQDSAGSDLYVVSLDPAGELSPERLLISDINTEFNVGCSWRIAPCAFDAKGRAQVYRSGAPQLATGLTPTRVDPVTGAIEDVIVDYNTAFSASGQRSFVHDANYTSGTLHDADGHATAIQLISPGQFSVTRSYEFVGDDFYFINPQNELIDIPPSDVPRQVATQITDFSAWPSPDGPVLILTRGISDAGVRQCSVRDPVSGRETPVPADGCPYAKPSPDWEWLLAGDTLVNWHTGATQVVDIPSFFNAQWRPGHGQLWGSEGGEGALSVWVVTPGNPPITVEGVALSGFSEDGAYWFGISDFTSSTPALTVGLADDPTGARFPYNPPGTALEGQWGLPDGRLLLSADVNNVQRADAIVVDPRTGDRRVLAERGEVAAVGQTRFIGMYHFETGRGDLTAVELDSGKATILAPEFTVTAFAEPQGTDLVAPGTRLLYQFQARTPSPWDGIWLTNCP
jgi:hypothetical protein